MEASTQDTNNEITTSGVDHPMSGFNHFVRGSSGTQADHPSTPADGSSIHPNDAQIPRPGDFMTTVPDAATHDSVDPSSTLGSPASTQNNEAQPVERQSKSISFEGMYTRDDSATV